MAVLLDDEVARIIAIAEPVAQFLDFRVGIGPAWNGSPPIQKPRAFTSGPMSPDCTRLKASRYTGP